MKYTKKFLRSQSEEDVVKIANEMGIPATEADLKEDTIEAIYAVQKERAGKTAKAEVVIEAAPFNRDPEEDLIWVVTVRRIGLDDRTSEVGERVQIQRRYARIHQKSGAVLIDI